MSVTLEQVSIAIAGRRLVDRVDLHVGDGERVGLIGASGSGKSLLAKAVIGLDPPEAKVEGRIVVDGVDVLRLDGRGLADLRGRSVGFVFQDPTAALSPVDRVGAQIALPLRLHYRLDRADRERRVRRIAERVGLDASLLRAFPHELSGGQRQRVAIAAALIGSPRLVIADEPTTALDAVTQRGIVDLLVDLASDSGASLLFITHDFSVLARAAQRVYVMDAGDDGGRIVESGAIGAILDAPHEPATRRLVEAARELTFARDHGLRTDAAATSWQDDKADKGKDGDDGRR